MAVYKRGSVWYYDITVGGKRIKRATTASDKRGAEVEATLAKREESANPNETRMTLRAAIMRCYNEEWRNQKDGLRTVNRTLKIVDILGDIPLKKVDEIVINRLGTVLTEKGLTQATLNRYRSHIRRVLNVAHRKWREIDRVPYIQNTKEVPKRFKVYSPAEEKLIPLSMPHPEFVDLAVILFDTGLRLGEALRLTKGEVDFTTNLITVWSDATKGEVTRSVPMTARVRALLEHRTLPFAFKDEHEIERIWTRFKKKQGITDGGWVIHAMRHTFASRLVRKGIDLFTVKELLGHSTITVTERYAHLNSAKLQAAVAVLERQSEV